MCWRSCSVGLSAQCRSSSATTSGACAAIARQILRVGVEEPELRDLRDRRPRPGRRRSRPGQQPREDARQLVDRLWRHLRPDHGRQVVLVRARVLVARLDPRPVWRRARGLVRASPEHLRAAHLGVGLQLLRRARLADARLADEHHQPALARHGVVERLPQPLQLLLAADEDAEREPVEDVGVGVRRGFRQPGRRARASPALRRRTPGARRDPSRAAAGSMSSSSCGQCVGVPGRRDGRRVDVLADHGARVVADERRPARDHLVQHAAERVEVGARRHLAARAPAPAACRPRCRRACRASSAATARTRRRGRSRRSRPCRRRRARRCRASGRDGRRRACVRASGRGRRPSRSRACAAIGSGSSSVSTAPPDMYWLTM